MKFLNWPKILWTIRRLNELNAKSYFDLEKFCIENGLSYMKIKNFLEVSNEIIDGESELIKTFEKEKKTLEKLNNLDADLLKGI